MATPMSMNPHSRNQSFDMRFQQIPQPDLIMCDGQFFPTQTPIQQYLEQSSQPELQINTHQRPYTPSHKPQNGNFLLTPAATPMQQQARMAHWSRQQEQDILSPRPVSMQKSRSLQGIAEHQEVQSFIDVFPPIQLDTLPPPSQGQEPIKQRQHLKNESISSIATFESTLYGELTDNVPQLEDKKPNLAPSGTPSSPTRPSLSPRRMSISDLNLEPGISASIKETDISLDDIAQFIEGPDSSDNKWTCIFEGCNKRFGRKENIKSHVQTHLGDRQFKCDHCQKCFVRGHDLKRHAKIHTGNKAYACLCGNAFARHDALTRHRQRGMCIGAFEGIVRKEIKRGRPRKHRPEMDDRLDKASRTRQHGHVTSGTESSISYNDLYTSSALSCSTSSWGSPPAQTMDNLSMHSDPFGPSTAYEETLNLFGLSSQELDINPTTGLATIQQVNLGDMYSFTPPHSPGYSTGNKPSPYHYREMTPTELASFDTATSPSQHTSPITNIINTKFDTGMDLIAPPQPTQLSDLMLNTQPAINPLSSSTIHFDLPSATLSQASSLPPSSSMPALSHSSSPPPEEPQTASTLTFDFDAPVDFRMSTMSNMSSMSFGLSSLNKIADNAVKTQGQRIVSRNQFDDFLDFAEDNNQTIMASDNDYAFDRQENAESIDWCS
ncbi:Metallothionein expression activator [Elasticomyces elasticus]|nr:Metallothionein expression activator [Elasticomyces elasticus]